MSETFAPLAFTAIAFLAVFTAVAYFATAKIASWLRPGLPLWRAAALSCCFWLAFFAFGQVLQAWQGRDASTPGLIEGAWIIAHTLAFAIRKMRSRTAGVH
jgi:hypothetical protein